MIDKSTIVNREFLSGGTLDLFFTKFSWFPLQYTCIKCIVKTKLFILFPFCLKSACCICGALSLPRLNFSKFPSQLQQNPHLQVFFNPVFFSAHAILLFRFHTPFMDKNQSRKLKYKISKKFRDGLKIRNGNETFFLAGNNVSIWYFCERNKRCYIKIYIYPSSSLTSRLYSFLSPSHLYAL